MPTTSTPDGVTVAYLGLGGAGPNLLLAHATGFSATAWRPLAERLTDHFTCWALDFRGHGLSGRPADGRFDWNGNAQDVLAVVDAVDATGPAGTGPAGTGPAGTGPAPWFGVGHSMGGAALVLAELRRPGTFAGLWLYEPIIFPASDAPSAPGRPPAPDPGEVLARGAARRRRAFPSAQVAFDNYASKPPMDVFDHAALSGYLERGLVGDDDPGAEAGSVRLACEPADEAQVYRMGGRHGAWSGLPAVTPPVTVVRGTDAQPGPASFAPLVAGRFPAGRLEDHPELGHFGPLQSPAAMAASVVAAFAPTVR